MRVPQIKKLTPLRCTVLPARNKYSFPILSEAIYLDTETSHNYDDTTKTGTGWVYQWAFRFCREFAFGRTPSELLDALDQVAEVNKLSADGVHCVIYIHNASYDLAYLKDWLFQRYGTEFKMIALSNHHYLTFEIGPWMIRCSYKLANRSLAKWGKDLGIKDRKRSGLIDYNIRRYQDTKLTKSDWVYMFYDCIALEECVLEEMRLAHDNLNSIPLTSTGYVRRDTRKEAHSEKKNREEFKKTRLDRETYLDCNVAFSGGLTHGNRFFSGKTVRGCIRHRDFRSHYPTQIEVAQKCPRGKWNLMYRWSVKTPRCSWDRIEEMMPEYCMLITAIVVDMEVKKGVTLPYAQECKFALQARDDYTADVVDNGRILRTKGTTVVCLTEIDWAILRRQYNFRECRIVKVRYAKAGPYPKYLRDVTNHYYYGKSHYKNEAKRLRKEGAADALIQDAEVNLMKSKAHVNGVYGMMATNPIRTIFQLDPGTGEWTHNDLTATAIEEGLEKYYHNRNSCLEYQHGIYVTAMARAELVEYVELIGYDHFLYADTDSIFYLSTPEIEERIEQRNKEKYENAIRLGAFVEVDGKKITYDCFELEDEEIVAFRFLHAKAYAYETSDGKLHATVAGVSRRDHKGYTREQELGCIDNLKNGFVFRRCGSTTVTYLESSPQELLVDGHRIEAAAAAILLPTTKTIKDVMHRDEDYYFEEVPNGEAVEEHYILR